jgi:hypothetical protein
MGIYGLGMERTLRHYEIYGGFDFKTCKIHDYTLSVKEPPNPQPWEDGFVSKKYSIRVQWDLDFFKKLEFNKPKFMTLGILNRSDTELYRRDFVVERDPHLVKLEVNTFHADILSQDKPVKAVMYLFDEDKQWSDRYETTVQVTSL